jgi:hypothetical protein
MRYSQRAHLVSGVLSAFIVIGAPWQSASAQTLRLQAEAPFLAENDAAMARMMDGMAAKPTGDVDRDFTEMMIPHHQGAIDMAQAELRYGHNEQLRRIAQEIIVEQQQEIAAMRLALGDPLPPSVPSPTQTPPAVKTTPPQSMTMSHGPSSNQQDHR